jgi:hypothetical protein
MGDDRREDRPGQGEGDSGGPGRPDRGRGPEGGNRGDQKGGQRPDGPGNRGPDQGRRRFGRHRPFRGGRRETPDQAPPEGNPEGKGDQPACPLCGKTVFDLSTALAANRETGEPAHFDCVLERVTSAETLGPGERLVYLGSGAFGVVESKDKGESAFIVKRRIQWEKEGDKKDWRKALSSRITNL